jgi:hypothetical protein
MAEAMAQNINLAEEFGCLLISYIQPDGNYLEHPILQRGVLWGVGRFANRRPQYARHAAGNLVAYMKSADPILRGLAAWAAGPIAGRDELPDLAKLTRDPGRLTVYRNGQIIQYSVGELAQEALKMVDGQPG